MMPDDRAAPGAAPLVLASGSRYRASVLRDAGYRVEIDAPDVDERSFDEVWQSDGAEALALVLAREKAHSVAPRHPSSIVVAGDQVGVLGSGKDPMMLVKHPSVDAAVEQLMAMSGTTHRLVNGMCVMDSATGSYAEGLDVQVVRMREFSEREARSYVARFEPFDTAGSYRLEDGPEMAPIDPFVVEVRGDGESGVLGMPLGLLARLLGLLSQPGT